MQEYSRILIEEYCMKHSSAKSKRLQKLVELSYDISAEGTEADSIFLERAIELVNNIKINNLSIDIEILR